MSADSGFYLLILTEITKMDKLKRAFSGDDGDDEQGIVAQVSFALILYHVTVW